MKRDEVIDLVRSQLRHCAESVLSHSGHDVDRQHMFQVCSQYISALNNDTPVMQLVQPFDAAEEIKVAFVERYGRYPEYLSMSWARNSGLMVRTFWMVTCGKLEAAYEAEVLKSMIVKSWLDAPNLASIRREAVECQRKMEAKRLEAREAAVDLGRAPHLTLWVGGFFSYAAVFCYMLSLADLSVLELASWGAFCSAGVACWMLGLWLEGQPFRDSHQKKLAAYNEARVAHESYQQIDPIYVCEWIQNGRYPFNIGVSIADITEVWFTESARRLCEANEWYCGPLDD